jgi:hypothetical protein
MLDESSYDLLLEESADVYKEEDGEPLIKFRKRVLYEQDCRAAYQNLRDAAVITDNRGMAAGNVAQEDSTRPIGKKSGTRYRPVLKNGKISNTQYAKKVNSGLVGYFDRNARFPYCRLTAYNLNHPDRFKAAMPLIRSVDNVFATHAPDRYAAQKAVVEQTSHDFYISGTVFTTITVNLNFQTAVHKDVGDYKQGFGVMSALRAGEFAGCYLCFPQYRIAVDMCTGDVCLADVHEWHGNTPLKPVSWVYERLSLVFYYREQMKQCGTATEERERAKRRKPGQPING